MADTPSLLVGSRTESVVGETPSLTAGACGLGPQTSTTETYTYADGQRVTRTANDGRTTLYIGGVYEQDAR